MHLFLQYTTIYMNNVGLNKSSQWNLRGYNYDLIQVDDEQATDGNKIKYIYKHLLEPICPPCRHHHHPNQH